MNSINNLEKHFARMGARFQVAEPVAPAFPAWAGRRNPTGGYALDVRSDRRGEFFELLVHDPARVPEATVMQVAPRERHLLLMVRSDRGAGLDRFLCGHDEREWFVAAVPGGASSVAQAREALKPAAVRLAQSRARVGAEEGNRRRNRAFVRQGEWFFVPRPRLVVDARLVLRDEPLSRGAGSKPHRVELVYRDRGEPVYVCAEYPRGLTEAAYRRLLQAKPSKRGLAWRRMTRNADVYARGAVRHPDHQTIVLREWHRVLMNTENETSTMQHVAFLD